MLNFKPAFAIPPGETIMEFIDEGYIKKEELIKKLDMSKTDFQSFVQGNIAITKDIADKLEEALGVHFQFWLNLEKNYQKDKKRLDELARFL